MAYKFMGGCPWNVIHNILRARSQTLHQTILGQGSWYDFFLSQIRGFDNARAITTGLADENAMDVLSDGRAYAIRDKISSVLQSFDFTPLDPSPPDGKEQLPSLLAFREFLRTHSSFNCSSAV